MEIEMNLSKILKTRIRYRVDTRQEIDEEQKQTLRADADLISLSGLEFHSRIEMKWVNGSTNESGLLLYQNVRATLHPRFWIEARGTYYTTDSFESAIYEYESDVSGAFSAPGLFGKGWRWYLLASYSASDVIKFSVKYAELRKSGVKSIGSGYDTIEGGLDNSMHVQIDISL
jgi:hypothetical protein